MPKANHYFLVLLIGFDNLKRTDFKEPSISNRSMFVRAYLRASTQEQDATRARAALEAFAAERGLDVATWYVENGSGASLKRPELFRLLSDCKAGDVLLIEQVDRLSRLNDADWEALKREIGARGVRIVALDLPTSWQSIATTDETTARILAAVNGMHAGHAGRDCPQGLHRPPPPSG